MKILFFAISILNFFTDNPTNYYTDGIESTVIQCGNDPDGNFGCAILNFDDGSDCLVIDNEGAPGGIVFIGC